MYLNFNFFKFYYLTAVSKKTSRVCLNRKAYVHVFVVLLALCIKHSKSKTKTNDAMVMVTFCQL